MPLKLSNLFIPTLLAGLLIGCGGGGSSSSNGPQALSTPITLDAAETINTVVTNQTVDINLLDSGVVVSDSTATLKVANILSNNSDPICNNFNETGTGLTLNTNNKLGTCVYTYDVVATSVDSEQIVTTSSTNYTIVQPTDSYTLTNRLELLSKTYIISDGTVSWDLTEELTNYDSNFELDSNVTIISTSETPSSAYTVDATQDNTIKFSGTESGSVRLVYTLVSSTTGEITWGTIDVAIGTDPIYSPVTTVLDVADITYQKDTTTVNIRDSITDADTTIANQTISVSSISTGTYDDTDINSTGDITIKDPTAFGTNGLIYKVVDPEGNIEVGRVLFNVVHPYFAVTNPDNEQVFTAPMLLQEAESAMVATPEAPRTDTSSVIENANEQFRTQAHNTAEQYCISRGLRLPTQEELNDVYSAMGSVSFGKSGNSLIGWPVGAPFHTSTPSAVSPQLYLLVYLDGQEDSNGEPLTEDQPTTLDSYPGYTSCTEDVTTTIPEGPDGTFVIQTDIVPVRTPTTLIKFYYDENNSLSLYPDPVEWTVGTAQNNSPSYDPENVILNSSTGSFVATENEDGYVHVTVTSQDGKIVDSKDIFITKNLIANYGDLTFEDLSGDSFCQDPDDDSDVWSLFPQDMDFGDNHFYLERNMNGMIIKQQYPSTYGTYTNESVVISCDEKDAIKMSPQRPAGEQVNHLLMRSTASYRGVEDGWKSVGVSATTPGFPVDPVNDLYNFSFWILVDHEGVSVGDYGGLPEEDVNISYISHCYSSEENLNNNIEISNTYNTQRIYSYASGTQTSYMTGYSFATHPNNMIGSPAIPGTGEKYPMMKNAWRYLQVTEYNMPSNAQYCIFTVNASGFAEIEVRLDDFEVTTAY